VPSLRDSIVLFATRHFRAGLSHTAPSGLGPASSCKFCLSQQSSKHNGGTANLCISAQNQTCTSPRPRHDFDPSAAGTASESPARKCRWERKRIPESRRDATNPRAQCQRHVIGKPGMEMPGPR